MNLPGQTPREARRQLLARGDALLVTRAAQPGVKPAPGQPGAASSYVQPLPDVFVAILAEGQVLAFNGHVDLGTGIRTSLAQIVAEELSVPMDRVSMILGHTEEAPNQGPTIASATIQISAIPLRKAAAQAREHLLAMAAARWDTAAGRLRVEAGRIIDSDVADRTISCFDLLRGQHIVLTLEAGDVPLKPMSQYTLVGRNSPRVDIPAKVRAEPVYVHDVRVPGMLHGRVVRPPHPGRDGGDFVGRSLLAVDRQSVAHIPGLVAVVVEGDFVGVVAEREEQAQRAMRELKVQWKTIPPLPPMDDLEARLRSLPARRRALVRQGDPEAVATSAAASIERTYVWPYQMHASIGPSCAVADWRQEGLTVWSGTQNPHVMRIDLSRLCDLDEGRIEVIRLEASGCYGRNCADDVVADAALLSRAVGRPVRVQLTREQEHAWEPKGAAQLMDVCGGIDARGRLSHYRFQTRYPSNDAPVLALLLTGRIAPEPRVLEMGDRTAVPPYAYPHMQVDCDDVAPIVRAGWLRGVSAMPNSFAHEVFIDELAELAGADRLAFRLEHLPDTRASELLQAVADKAGWVAHAHGSRGKAGADGRLRGRGIAYARYVHSKFPGFGAAWSAWVIDVEVDPGSGALAITSLVVGQDTGMMVNPAGVRHQMHGNILQSLSRVLKERVAFGPHGTSSLEWGAYPILHFTEVPPIEIVLMERQDQPPMGAGESASVPSAAALSNALFDATGRRLREPPFNAQCILAALQEPLAAA
ncbi:molybdopterin-dependent oxidoreductase [Herbaspirillum sp. WGmk3]|uniref:xanthine dehydrogenase family protein molybdopterin-binding subunit n=1 Tax=Herbaspirillum sp. WGmk3 TaxID=2919925 RepID=UPI0020903ECE|nr:molybdopterin cofactor-binding domain-containing protein [Herbaspirillum sp. WGmk3]MCO4858370.1 molybdopterin-dependent oxidoreductase [Herbaspirillum sp. WGmk3]